MRLPVVAAVILLSLAVTVPAFVASPARAVAWEAISYFGTSGGISQDLGCSLANSVRSLVNPVNATIIVVAALSGCALQFRNPGLTVSGGQTATQIGTYASANQSYTRFGFWVIPHAQASTTVTCTVPGTAWQLLCRTYTYEHVDRVTYHDTLWTDAASNSDPASVRSEVDGSLDWAMGILFANQYTVSRAEPTVLSGTVRTSANLSYSVNYVGWMKLMDTNNSRVFSTPVALEMQTQNIGYIGYEVELGKDQKPDAGSAFFATGTTAFWILLFLSFCGILIVGAWKVRKHL